MTASDALFRFLSGLGLEDYAGTLGAERIEPEDLPLLSDADLAALGIPLGPRRRLQRALAERRPEGPHVPDRERRNLTILFCDMANSTSAAVELDPEDLRTRFRTFRAACTTAIEAEDGFAAHRLGDGIMAYFGYPAASEDAAICAVRAGHDIVARVARLEAPGGPMSVRVGIATGLTVIEDFRDSQVERDEIATGATLALSARLQSMAEPGQVLLADSTRRLLRDSFVLRSLGRQRLKGFTEPEEVWLSEAPRAAGTTGRPPEPDRMVGRKAERKRLLEAWETCRAGTPGAIVIEGEAGVGKSRLLADLSQVARATGSLITLQCQRHRHGATLHPVADWLERTVRETEGGLAALPGVTPETAPLLGTLLSGETRVPAPVSNDPQSLQDSILDAVTDLLSAPFPEAAGPGRMVVLEDLHWADEATRAVLDRITARRREPILMVAAMRPDHGYTAPEGSETIHLSPLSPEATEILVSRQTGAEALTAAIRRTIAERSGGVPLFAEELTRAMLESPATVGDVPFTLRDTLTARLDRLGHGKPLAQLGALFGREFSHDVLAACTDMDGETLKEGLAALIESNLVVVSDRGERLYTFRHSLIRDVAYDSMLKTRRVHLHRMVANVIGEKFPHLARAQPERQAHHYTEAGDHGRAVPHWQQAAELALTRGSSLAAADYFGMALSLLEKIRPTAARTETEITLRVRLNVALTVTTGFSSEATEANLARLEALYGELKPDPAALQLLWSNAMSALVKSDLQRARATTLQLERLSRQASLPNATRLPDRLLGYISILEGEMEQAEAHFGRVFEGYVVPEGFDPILQGHPFDVLAASLSQCAILKALRDDRTGADDFHRRAMKRLESFDSPATTFQVLVHLCVARFELGEHALVPELVAGLREVVDTKGVAPLYVEIWEGWDRARSGDLEAGLHDMEVAQTQRKQYGLWMPRCTLLRVELLAAAGRHKAALDLLDRCDTEIDRYRQGYLRSETMRRRALSLRASGAPVAAVGNLLRRAADLARRQGILRFERLARADLAALSSAPA